MALLFYCKISRRNEKIGEAIKSAFEQIEPTHVRDRGLKL